MKHKTLFKALIVLSLFIIMNINANKKTNNTRKTEKIWYNNINNLNHPQATLIEKVEKNIYEDLLATISIQKITLLNKPIYNPTSYKNNIEKNISILKESSMPDNNSSIIFLLAHSGIGEKAYFKDIHKLEVKDTINLTYNAIDYTYRIEKIYEDNKNGYLQIRKEYQHELVLTTCSEKEDKQLIVISSLIRKSNK